MKLIAWGFLLFLTVGNCAAFQARVTSYCADEDEANGSHSCTGEELHVGEVAADLDIYPLGTILKIDGEEYTVADCGSAVQGARHFDRYCDSRSDMNEWGTHICEVEVVDRQAFSSKRQQKHPRCSQSHVCRYSSKLGTIFI